MGGQGKVNVVVCNIRSFDKDAKAVSIGEEKILGKHNSFLQISERLTFGTKRLWWLFESQLLLRSGK